MLPTTNKHISHTQEQAASLQFAHRWLLKVHPHLTEEQWQNMMFEAGIAFATSFSFLFDGKQQHIEDVLTKHKADDNNTNWFWMWFKYKWMEDDWHYITNKVFTQPTSYHQYKSYMLLNQLLEEELLTLLEDKIPTP